MIRFRYEKKDGEVKVYGSDKFTDLFNRMDNYYWGEQLTFRKIDRFDMTQKAGKHDYYLVFASDEATKVEVAPSMHRLKQSKLVVLKKEPAPDHSYPVFQK